MEEFKTKDGVIKINGSFRFAQEEELKQLKDCRKKDYLFLVLHILYANREHFLIMNLRNNRTNRCLLMLYDIKMVA